MLRAFLATLLLAAPVYAECRIAILPDTQYMAFPGDPLPDLYRDWIEGGTYDLVIHPGDVVQTGLQVERYARWTDALAPATSYVVTFGNHDGPAWEPHFGASSERYPLLLGSYGERSYAIRWFCDGTALTLATLGYSDEQDPAAHVWAKSLIEDEGRPALLVTHSYGFQNYSGKNGDGRTPEGEAVWAGLVRDTPLIFGVFSGHRWEWTQTVTNTSGATVLESMANYQGCDPLGFGASHLQCKRGNRDGLACDADADCPNGTCVPQPGYGDGWLREVSLSLDEPSGLATFDWDTVNIMYSYPLGCPECLGCPAGNYHTTGTETVDLPAATNEPPPAKSACGLGPELVLILGTLYALRRTH